MKKQYFDRHYNLVKRGDYVQHSLHGLCKVVGFEPRNNQWYINLKRWDTAEAMDETTFLFTLGHDIDLIHKDDDFAEYAGFELDELQEMGF